MAYAAAAVMLDDVNGTVGDPHAAGVGGKDDSYADDRGALSNDKCPDQNHAESCGEECLSLTKTDENRNNGKRGSAQDGVDGYEEACISSDKSNEFLLQTLDAIEMRVEKMRETARSVEDEKTTLLRTLNTMMQSEAITSVSEADREELGMFIDRLVTRCLTVDISIQTVRTAAQEQSLERVRSMLRDLLEALRAGATRCRQQLEIYLNSCLDCANFGGPIDERFQGAVLGCAAEDQKLVKRKLRELRDMMDHTDGLIAKLRAISLDL